MIDEKTKVDEMEMVFQIIGTVDVEDGRDEYVLMIRKDDELTRQQAHDWLLPRVYRNSNGAGQYYCTKVRVLQEDYLTNRVVCIIEHRYDI
jgi:hypothetical protein